MPYPAGASSVLGSATRRPPLPLFLALPSGEPVRPAEVDREPGDEATRIVRLDGPSGSATVADCHCWLECDCPAGRVGAECDHVAALVGAGIFRRLPTSTKGGLR